MHVIPTVLPPVMVPRQPDIPADIRALPTPTLDDLSPNTVPDNANYPTSMDAQNILPPGKMLEQNFLSFMHFLFFFPS